MSHSRVPKTVIATYWASRPSRLFHASYQNMVSVAGTTSTEYMQVKRVKRYVDDTFQHVSSLILEVELVSSGIVYPLTISVSSSGIISGLNNVADRLVEIQALVHSLLATQSFMCIKA